MIFHLPNGLQAYMLMDALGRRIDKAPGEIVADPRRPDQRVETGISCMSCHARGLLPKADQLRAHVEKNAQAFNKSVVDAVRATHPRKAQFEAQVAQDNARYLRALEKFGVRDPEQEPVNLVTQRFEATLDGPTAAAELGLSVLELGLLLKQNPDHARLFGTLLVGGTAQREVFQANYPELARRLVAMQATLAARTAPKAEAAFQGHTGTVNSIVFSADGQSAATGSDDRTVRIWEVSSGKQLASLQGNSGEVLTVALSGNGKWLLSAGNDRLLRLWDLRTRKETRVFQGHTAAVRCVAFSPDGKQAVSGGDDRVLRIWDVASGEEQAAMTGHTQAVTSVVWSKGHTNAVVQVQFLPGSRQFLSSSSQHKNAEQTFRRWDIGDRAEIGTMSAGEEYRFGCAAFAPDGRHILVGGPAGFLRLWSW